MSPQPTTSQTVGPFLTIGMDWLNTGDVARGVSGERITIEGRVLDGDGQPVADASIELWQANAQGKYEANASGFGRCPTDGEGAFRFTTVKPGAAEGHAPHIAVNVFARGLLKQLVTRIYFPNDRANDTDPVVSLVPAPRRATLIAIQSARRGVLEWNVVLRGKDETVFFDC